MKSSIGYIAFMCFFLYFNVHNTFGQQLNSKKTHPSKLDLNNLDDKITQWQKVLNIPNVAISIIENNKVLDTKVYGNLSNGDTAPKNMIFEVASLTKVVFSTLVLKLVDQKRWKLDEPLAKYFIDPEVASDPYSRKITTRDILSHQSGFDNWRWMNSAGKLKFNFEPGTKFNYSGEGMEYLRSAIERKFHTSLSNMADSLLFKPLNMFDTNHQWNGKKNFERYARMYDADGAEIKKADYSIQASAAAGLTTTIDDLSKFAVEVLKGAHLSRPLYNEMIKTQSVINPNLQQGLGWRVINDLPNNEYALQHGGNDPGVAAIIVLLPKSKRGIIVLTNADNGLIMCNNIVRAVFPEGKEIIHKAFKSSKLNEIPKVIQLSDSTLKNYEGHYKREDGVDVTVTVKNQGLVLRMAGIPLLNLLPQTEERFFLMDMDAKVFFTKNNDGTVNSVTIQDGDNNIKCIKVYH
ncbi:serine hydrolase [Sphingobacterium spiritivorum]|nr:serine hydrolase [Sphingobacterium spiritivorum]